MFKSTGNVGYIYDKLDAKAMNRLKSYIKNKKDRMNDNLAGNIESSFSLEDKDNWFFKNSLLPLIKQYSPDHLKAIVPSVLTQNCPYVLNTIWVNFQNKYEFNPVHNHSGIFSFVVWMEIPSSFKKEKELKFIKDSNSPCPNTFEFIFTNILGQVSTERFYLEPEHKGNILLFPSKLLHQVYPFYSSNKKRVSISGNIAIDSRKHEL